MNTSRNNRSIRKKTYSKYKNSSLSDILKTGNTLAAYKKRIKELLRNNKSLAVSLQDAKYKAAIQEKEKEEYTRTYTQVSHARLKLKDMACTIQKLVYDLEEVRGCLYVNSFNLLKNFDSIDHRLKIQVPDHSTIEESASMSVLESDLSTPEGSGSLRVAVHANSPMAREDSITEVYDHKTVLARVDSVLKACLVKSQEEKNAKIQITDNSVFTNTSKKGNFESTSTTAHQTDGNAPNIELAEEGADNDVFEFSASDSECANTETLTSSSVIEKSKKTMTVGSQEQVVEGNNKPMKDSIKEKVPLVKQYKNEENSKMSSSNIDKSKKILTVGNREPVIEKNKVKHVESVISEVAKSTLMKDALCNTEAVAPILHGGKHKKTSKDVNQEQLTTATEKHKVDPTKKLKSKQVVQSTLNNEEAPSNDKMSSSAQNKALLFNRVDFKTTHLDDLTNNDFVPPKTKKLYNDPKDKEDRAVVKEKSPTSKKPHEEKSNSEELKAKSKETAIVEAHIDPKSSKDAPNFEAVFPAKVEDSIPIHRQNCSGSIGSFSHVESRENEGRPSRRNRATKSYKEPKLNCKMRR